MGKVKMVKCEMKDLEERGIIGKLDKVDIYLDYQEGVLYFVKQEDLGELKALEI